ncbi:uncharacterized protein LOC124127084 isoform X2 [Haliotis rufescens]|uniref:uncharacterized protein LOC124127084 isoform X2 n=1 Tax=Haliotis rufescens TaxID=6454 RepID=UPI00201F85D5|nr:uncharacterized protein LOC124127084 isoform X2 [Haliotis rufescens]
MDKITFFAVLVTIGVGAAMTPTPAFAFKTVSPKTVTTKVVKTAVSSNNGSKFINLSPCPASNVSSAEDITYRPPSENINVDFVLQSGNTELFDHSKMAAGLGRCARQCTESTTCVSFAFSHKGSCYAGAQCDPGQLPETVLYYEMSVFR